LGDLGLQCPDVGDDVAWVAVLDLLVDDLLVAVDRQVVVVGLDVGLRHAEALVGTSALQFCSVALGPASERVGQVVLGVLLIGEARSHGAEE